MTRLPPPSSSRCVLLLVGLMTSALMGCQSAPQPKADSEITLPPKTFRVEPKGDDGLEVYDAEDLMKRADDLFAGEAYKEAASYCERVIREFPGDEEVTPARYSAAECYIRLEQGEPALGHLDALLSAYAEDDPKSRRLRFRRGAALMLVQRYEDAAEVFDIILLEALTTPEHIEALVDSGVAHFMREDRTTSEQRLMRAGRLYRQAPYFEKIPVKYFAAQARFYLAEIARIDFETFVLRFPDDGELEKTASGTLEIFLGEQLEEKCQRLLRAQYQYLRVIRSEHVGWASAAGYKVGTMYEHLYAQLTTLPIPGDIGGSAQQLYKKLLQQKVAILLEKALRVWQSTADMATRTGADNQWVAKSRESLDRVRTYVAEVSESGPDVPLPAGEPPPPTGATPAGDGAAPKAAPPALPTAPMSAS